MKMTITGGAGFIGSNLCDYFVTEGMEVTCLDNLSTGFKHNIEHLLILPITPKMIMIYPVISAVVIEKGPILNDRKLTQIIESHTIAVAMISRPYKHLRLYLMNDPHHAAKKHISSKKR